MPVYPVRLILLLIGALLAPTTLGPFESGRLSCPVRDAATSERAVGASVVVVGTSRSTVTDGNGHYVIANVPVGTYTVVARFIGYASGEKKGIRVTANATAVADLKIASIPIALQEVVVTGLYGSRAANGVVPVRGATALGYLGSEADALQAQRFDSTEAWRYQRQPGNREQYDEIVENSFIAVAADPLSTFSIDVDRASYSNMRRFIMQDGQLPPRDAVRIEELVNYFPYDYAEPEGDDPLAIHTEVAPAPWKSQHQLVRIGLQARRVKVENLPASNFVFLVDVSGSMMQANKLPLVKSAMRLLVNQLRAKDRVAMVVYAGSAGLVLPSTPGDQKDKILDAIERLEAGGSTAGGEGIRRAYDEAVANFIRGGNNRVILATDGDFNVGPSSDAEIRMPDSLRYQNRNAQSTSAAGPELLFVKVRYKQPDGDQSRLISQPVLAQAGQAPSVDFQFQAAVAEFGLLLRNSDFRGKADLGHVIAAAREARGKDADGYRAEFVKLAEAVRGIGLARRDGQH